MLAVSCFNCFLAFYDPIVFVKSLIFRMLDYFNAQGMKVLEKKDLKS